MVLQGGAGITPHVGESLPIEGFTAMAVKPESPAADTKLATAHKSEKARQHLLRGSMEVIEDDTRTNGLRCGKGGGTGIYTPLLTKRHCVEDVDRVFNGI
jgi:hypothetical protein